MPNSRRQPRCRRAPAAWGGLLLAAFVLPACGSSSSGGRADARPGSHSEAAVIRGSGVSAASVAVIKGWADALRTGHTARAAAYWAHPSAMVNGPDASGRLTIIRVRDTHEALIADETLSCGATLRSTSRRGAYVEASFTLTIRAGAGASHSGCAGPARVDFLIRDGHITRWLRAPVTAFPPPGGGSPRPSGSQPI